MIPPLLEFEQIDKSFFGVEVLHGVSFTVEPGQAVGLIGENGAGKSTLMNILGGNLRATRGRMRLSGIDYQLGSPLDADRSGIAFIHQELNLFSNLSIEENLFLSRFPRKWGLIRRREVLRRTLQLLKEVGLQRSPAHLVEDLSAGERQLVEIAKALKSNARLIIFDEPTTSLSAREINRLFALLNSLQSQGIALIYISHTLSDVQRLCERIIVLRDGKVVGNELADGLDQATMISLMVGRKLEQLFPARTETRQPEVALRVEKINQPGIVKDISFSLSRGEILGVAGLMGSGRTELARILFGLDPMQSGTIELHGQRIESLNVRRRTSLGMAFITESRRLDGLCMQASIFENLTLPSGAKFANSMGWIKREAQREAVNATCEWVQLTPMSPLSRPVRTLSGGNQQKIVLAKWLLYDPCLLILDEPTRGIDIVAKYEIYRLMNEIVAGGSSILMISSEIEELIGMCDRIFVMNRGEFKLEITRPEFDQERILSAMLHQGELLEGQR